MTRRKIETRDVISDLSDEAAVAYLTATHYTTLIALIDKVKDTLVDMRDTRNIILLAHREWYDTGDVSRFNERMNHAEAELEKSFQGWESDLKELGRHPDLSRFR